MYILCSAFECKNWFVEWLIATQILAIDVKVSLLAENILLYVILRIILGHFIQDLLAIDLQF